MTETKTEVTESKEDKLIARLEKRFPKDLYKVKDDEKDIVIVPKNPNVLKESRRLLLAEGIDEKEVDRLFELRPFPLASYFRKRRQPRNVEEWLEYFFS
jgi:hypothetical protein